MPVKEEMLGESIDVAIKVESDDAKLKKLFKKENRLLIKDKASK
jgi:hypothetical protein